MACAIACHSFVRSSLTRLEPIEGLLTINHQLHCAASARKQYCDPIEPAACMVMPRADIFSTTSCRYLFCA